MAQAIILKDEVEGKKVKSRSMQNVSKPKKQVIARGTRHNPADKLLALIAKGLQEHASQSTVSQLGDRSKYVGMSDIGQNILWSQECPRFAVLRKVQGENNEAVSAVSMDNYEHILKRQLTLQRGHWAKHREPTVLLTLYTPMVFR